MVNEPMRVFCALALAATAVACYDSARYQPLSPSNEKGFDLDAVIALSATPASIPADGASRTQISARLDPMATVRTVSFATSSGTLSGNGQTAAAPAASLPVVADGNGVATVQLRSSAEVTTARVTATMTLPAVQGVSDARTIVRTLDIPFEPPNPDQLLTLESSQAALPADSFSTATITATLKVPGDLRQDVTFTTSRGALVKFGAVPGDAGTTVKADVSGVARIQLRSDATVGTARVSATALGFERELFVSFVPVNPAEIITVEADEDDLPADGASRVRVVARVSPDLPDANRLVTFTTTDGTFTTNLPAGSTGQTATVKADASNVAIVEIRSPAVPATATITAAAANVTARTEIDFTRALPDTVFVEASAAAVPRVGNGSVTVTVRLLRDVGQVSNNTIVTYQARDAAGAIIGSFSAVELAITDSTDPSQFKRLRSSAVFNPDDAAALGIATITARAGGASGAVTVRLE